MPSAGGGAGWALAVARFELGETEKARRMMLEVGGEDMENWFPAERCFNWENVALAELALGNAEAADAVARRAEETAAELDLRLPTVLAARTRAAVQLARGDAEGAAAAAEQSIAAGEVIGATSRWRLAQPAGACAGRDRRSPAGDRGAARGRARARRLRVFRVRDEGGASCASSARAQRRADGRPPTTRGSSR